jgi:hypothetical protein
MEQIQQELESRRLSQQMINFLMKEYPFAVEEIKEAGDVKPTAMRGQLMVTAHDQDVFEHYNPNLLTFPQRIIIKNDDPEGLKRDVNDFIINKVGVDYLIMDNMAFIEYFKLKYSAEAKMVALESRELYKYRQLHGIVPYQRIVSKNTIGGV